MRDRAGGMALAPTECTRILLTCFNTLTKLESGRRTRHGLPRVSVKGLYACATRAGWIAARTGRD